MIYRNEAGEPLGWDYPDSNEPDPYDDDMSGSQGAADAAAEDAYDEGTYAAENGEDRDEGYGAAHTSKGNRAAGWLQDTYNEGYADALAAQS